MTDHTTETDGIVMTDEHLLFEFLDEHLNANGVQPEVVGYDRDRRAFFAWLDEEGGDCVGLRVCVLGPHEGRAEVSAPGEIEAPGQGEVSSLRYPVLILPSDRHDCATCADCLHGGRRCCGCYDGACCQDRQGGGRS